MRWVVCLILLAQVGAGVLGGNPGGSIWPPWTAPRRETPIADPALLSACRDAVRLVAGKSHETIVEEKDSLSPEWGRVLRAKTVSVFQGVRITMRVMCWTKDGRGVYLAVEPDDAGGAPVRP